MYRSKKRPIIPYLPELKEKARYLRNNSTKSEIHLWAYLKGKQMHGFDFHRQRPVDRFIIDFFCSELFLGIELDGSTHFFEKTERNDYTKEQRLKQLGVNLLRFEDKEVLYNTEGVLEVIENVVLLLRDGGRLDLG